MVVEGPRDLVGVPRPRESRAFWGAGRPGWSGCPGRGLFRFWYSVWSGSVPSTSRFGAENVNLFVSVCSDSGSGREEYGTE